MAGIVKGLVVEAKQAVDSMTVDELSAQMDMGDTLVLLDSRTEAEYETGRIRGAVWIPRDRLEFMAPKTLFAPMRKSWLTASRTVGEVWPQRD